MKHALYNYVQLLKLVPQILQNMTGRPGFDSPAGAGDSYLLHSVKSGSATHPASCPMGTGGYFSWIKAAGA
jgi:hypothetical protein